MPVILMKIMMVLSLLTMLLNLMQPIQKTLMVMGCQMLMRLNMVLIIKIQQTKIPILMAIM